MVAKFPIVCKKCGIAEKFNENPAVEVFQREDGIDIYFTDWGAHAYCKRCDSRIYDFNLPSFVVSMRLDKHPTVRMI
jgi:hypothetical protein